ncbi:MAG: ATP-binding cassette domain-containing protein, partial [Finegoldia magna]|nr:ATP-binding cassette domain-containing protein [Finegoldia magna]
YVILGHSGSGKSTLLKILANILSNTSGNLYLNESEYSIHKNISQMISFVSQETFIFNDTLKNNITLYNEYSDEEINKAIEFSLLENLKDRKIQQNSNLQDTLSGGERKKIGLARAILNDTDVILLDELNSSLDSTSSKILEDRIFDLKDKTIVMVTHKINYHNLVKADEIICMDDGEIVENGNLEELLEKQGYFYRNFGELYGKYFRD